MTWERTSHGKPDGRDWESSSFRDPGGREKMPRQRSGPEARDPGLKLAACGKWLSS